METTALSLDAVTAKIVEQGALFAFMFFCVVGLCLVIKALYARITKNSDDQQKIIVDSTLAINNNTTALSALTKQVERLANVR